MADGYEYDLFLSFPSRGSVFPWVVNHLYPLLGEALLDLHGSEKSIYCYTDRNDGVDWPNEICRAVKRSRLLVSVLCPAYFYSSPWSCAEWRSFHERQNKLGFGTEQQPQCLILPVLFCGDVATLPEEARRVRIVTNLSKYWNPDPSYRNAPDYHDLRLAVRALAEQILLALDHAPPWAADWPVGEAKVFPRPKISKPTLAA